MITAQWQNACCMQKLLDSIRESPLPRPWRVAVSQWLHCHVTLIHKYGLLNHYAKKAGFSCGLSELSITKPATPRFASSMKERRHELGVFSQHAARAGCFNKQYFYGSARHENTVNYDNTN